MMRRARQLALAAFAIVAMSAAAAAFATRGIAFIAHAERFVADLRTALLLPDEQQNNDIVVVAITEETLQLFPYRSPVDRRFLAELLRVLVDRKPRAIGLDILFDQPTEPGKDDELRAMLAEIQTPLVVSYLDSADIVNADQKTFLDRFVPQRLRAYASLADDAFDGTVRWYHPGHLGPGGTFLDSFAAALVRRVGVRPPERQIEIAWRGRPDPETPPFRTFPAHLVRVLPPAWFRDKIVLIGADLSLTDRHRTPFAAALEGNAGILPGIVIQAHSIAQVLERRPSTAPGLLQLVLVIGGLCVVGTGLGIWQLRMTPRLVLAGAVLTVFWGGSFVLFRTQAVMLPMIAPTLGFALALWMADTFTGREARRQREFIQSAFSRYVPRKVVEELVRDPSKLSLQGERRTMSFLFTDVADFTTFSETIDSHHLSDLLTEYLSGLCNIVHKHDGTVDKFIGDAVFAIFNAPTVSTDHEERAARCALDIDLFAEEFRAAQRKAGLEFGVTRIGVHSGEAVVGNFGAATRFEYTALGDAVNTASRLEGVNKFFGTRVCISDATRQQCRRGAFRPVAVIQAKGKLSWLKVWEPLTPERAASAYIARYNEAYRLLEAGDPSVEELLERLHQEEPDDPCVLIHVQRVRRGIRDVRYVLDQK